MASAGERVELSATRRARAPARCLLAVLALAALAAPPALAGKPKERPTKADQALARRANLTLADFPAGWKATPEEKSESEFGCQGFRPDFSDLTRTGRSRSPDFSRGQAQVWAGVNVYRSLREARTFYERVAQPGFLRCMRRVLEGLSTKDVTVRIVSAAERSFPRLGDRLTAFRVAASFEDRQEKLLAYFDLFVVQRGRGVAGVFALDVSRPVGAALEGALVARVASGLGS